MTGWSLVAYGAPGAQGSKIRTRYGMREASAKVTPWRQDVHAAGLAMREAGAACLDGPIAVRMIITVPRPKSAPKKRRHPDTSPDLDKLARSTSDSITTAGLWADDARVVEFVRLAKVWAGYDDEALPMPGVLVMAEEIAPGRALEVSHSMAGAAVAADQWARFGQTPPAVA